MKSIFYATIMACLAFTCGAALADEADNTDQTLLEDLGADLLQPADLHQPSEESRYTAIDERLLAELGEDIGQPQDARDDGLAKVVGHMRSAQRLLEQPEEDLPASSVQAEALTGLDAMIAELTARQSQCKGGHCKKPGPPKPSQKPGSGKKPGQSPAQSNAPAVMSQADPQVDLAAAGDLVKDLWGQLPERQRQQILQPLSDEFLPKYATEIEAYFRALARPAESRLTNNPSESR